MFSSLAGFTILSWIHLTTAGTLEPQTDTWNSTFSLSVDQIQRAGLDYGVADNINVAIGFERSNWAGSSVKADSFYKAIDDSSHLSPGSLLAVENYTNTSLYTIPPGTSLSRFMFQSETFNGSAVPVSGYVLWPYMPRHDPACPGKYQVVVWGHGASGCFAECAPSHIQNLWYQYSAPYILALQGYVVVAPDYAGLGVVQHPKGGEIKHTYLSNAQGNDLIHAVKAAQEAFPELSHRFVIMGHSQGGHAAWAAAEKLAREPVEGYLGVVAASPPTDLSILLQAPALASLGVPQIAQGLDDIFPSFHQSRWLTSKGVAVWNLMKGIGACNSGLLQVASPHLIKDGVQSTWEWQAYTKLNAHGGERHFAGPMLVLQGVADPLVAEKGTTEVIKRTCEAAPSSRLEYLTFEGAGHEGILYAGQQIWLGWIADRFAGREPAGPCTKRSYGPARPVESYQKSLSFFLEYATQTYQIA